MNISFKEKTLSDTINSKLINRHKAYLISIHFWIELTHTIYNWFENIGCDNQLCYLSFYLNPCSNRAATSESLIKTSYQCVIVRKSETLL